MFGTFECYGQDGYFEAAPERAVDANFLFTYYDQDGDHSAVTGGLGTQALTDYASLIVVNVPLDSVSDLSVTGGFNYYTSASTDNIDQDVSSASSSDIRAQVYVRYSRSEPARRLQYSIKGGGSVESDYISSSIGGEIIVSSENGNNDYTLGAQAFFDKWLPILPVELRSAPNFFFETDKRNTYNFTFAYGRVINKRMQIGISTEIVHQRGLLSTPFHRVYLADGSTDIERLPGHKWRFPFGIRMNYFAGDFLILRSYYRFYIDNFGIKAHTASLEPTLKAGNFFSFYPFYRFHSQTAADYFLPYGMHPRGSKLHTSDYDLSAFNSHHVGLGFRYAPLYGIARFRMFKGSARFHAVEIRYGHYFRGDGLEADMVSTDLSFSFW